MINNGLAGSLEKSSQGIDRIDKGDIGAGIKECAEKNARIEEVETNRKKGQEVGAQTVTMQDDKNYSLVDGIREDMGEER